MDGFLPIGICGSLADIPILSQAGADFLEVNVQHVLIPARVAADFATSCEEASKSGFPILAANCFLPPSLPCIGPTADETALLAYAASAFERASLLGIDCIVFGSGLARRIPANLAPGQARAQFIGLLTKFAPLADEFDVTMVIEPLNSAECNFINTLAEGAEIVAACEHPRIRLLEDTYHMGFSGEGPDALRAFGLHLHHFHVAEYPSRRYPGADGTRYRHHFEALRETGYQGCVSVECKWDDLAVEVARAVDNLRGDLGVA